MKKLSQICVLLCAIAPLAAFSVTPDQPASTNSAGKGTTSLDTLFGDTVIAKGKGVEVKRTDLDAAVVKMKSAYAARQIPAPADLEPQALKNIVIQQLILSKATDADRAAAKTKFQDSIAKFKKAKNLTDEEFDKQISMQLFGGETRAQWEKQQIDVVAIPIVLEREMGVKITDEDIKKFYDDPANISAFEQPEMVRASHILIMTQDPTTHEPLPADKKAEKKKQIEDILKQAKAPGADFAALAKKYSEDPGSKETGGEYTFPKGRMVKEFEDTAFSLKTNEISGIVETTYGYHIIKLSEHMPAKKVDLSEVKDGIKDHLVQMEFQKRLPDYTNKLEKDANIQILDEKLKGTDLTLEAPKEENAPPAAPAPVPTNK
jgi:parvulin-like peptidyl-prolyl isomerase